MTIYWHEKPESRSGSLQVGGGSRTAEYVILGTSSDATAYSTALANLAAYDSFGNILTDVALKMETSGSADVDWAWAVTATYSHPQSQDSQDGEAQQENQIDFCRYDFDIATTNGHISHAIHQTEYPGGFVDDAGQLRRAIEATYDGDVRGVDIPLPEVKLNVWKIWPRAFWRGSAGIVALKNLGRVVAKTNDKPWWGFDRGEVLFLGARPEDIGVYATKVTYQFALSENRRNIDFGEIGNGFNVNVPLKRGHEYIWVYHKRQPVANPAGGGNVMATKPWLVCVAQVIEETDFGILGLPNAPP